MCDIILYANVQIMEFFISCILLQKYYYYNNNNNNNYICCRFKKSPMFFFNSICVCTHMYICSTFFLLQWRKLHTFLFLLIWKHQLKLQKKRNIVVELTIKLTFNLIATAWLPHEKILFINGRCHINSYTMNEIGHWN